MEMTIHHHMAPGRTQLAGSPPKQLGNIFLRLGAIHSNIFRPTCLASFFSREEGEEEEEEEGEKYYMYHLSASLLFVVHTHQKTRDVEFSPHRL